MRVTRVALMSGVTKKVPADRYSILDYSTNIAFRGRDLKAFVRRAFQLGYSRLGHIVQLPENELRALASSDAAFEKVVSTLQLNRLEVTMAAPGWISPDDLRRPGTARAKGRPLRAEL